MKLKKTLILLTLFLDFIAAPVQAKVDKITLSSPFSPMVMPMAYMVENNLLEDVAEKTELKIWNTSDQLRVMLTNGETDFVSIPSNVAAIFYNKGVKLKMVNISIWGVMYIISANEKITTLSDLKGQTIYVPFRGDQPDLIFQTICKSQGLDPFKDFNVQYARSPLDITMGLFAGTIKNAFLIEPAASMVMMKGKEKGINLSRVIDIQKELGKIDGWESRFPNAGVIALPRILQQKGVVNVFSKAYKKAVKWTVAHPKEASELASKYVPGINAKAFENALKYTIFDAVSSSKARLELEKMFNTFSTLNPKSIGKKLPDNGFYY